MIISLSDLVNMCKMQTNSHFQTRSERLLIIHIKEYINRPRHYERSLLEQLVFLHDQCSVRSDM